MELLQLNELFAGALVWGLQIIAAAGNGRGKNDNQRDGSQHRSRIRPGGWAVRAAG